MDATSPTPTDIPRKNNKKGSQIQDNLRKKQSQAREKRVKSTDDIKQGSHSEPIIDKKESHNEKYMSMREPNNVRTKKISTSYHLTFSLTKNILKAYPSKEYENKPHRGTYSIL